MDKLNEEFIYQKKDFVKLGVKEGSFYKMIKDLEIDTPEYCTTKILKNGIQAKCFNQKAFDIISKYINEKGLRNSKNELALVNENISLKEENQKLQNAVAILESQYTKQIAELKDEWHNIEKQLLERNGSLIKEGAEKDKQLFEQQKEMEIVGNMNFWQFRKWKKEQRKNKQLKLLLIILISCRLLYNTLAPIIR